MSIAANDFAFVRDLVLERSAIVLEPGKEYLVESRLMPLARKVGEPDVAALVARLRRTRETQLQAEVVDALTTNETSWFRDRHPYDALASHVLPEMMEKRRSEQRLSIWSAACSSGQEPYSIAMTLADHAPALASWSTKILATDLSSEMLERAQSGHYSQLEVNRGLPASHLVRHFERDGTGWRVRKQLRDMVTFHPHNLIGSPPPYAPFDIIFMRNVLIYFSVETRREILASVRRLLRPDGYFVLGSSETTLNLDGAFYRTPLGQATFYKVERRESVR